MNALIVAAARALAAGDPLAALNRVALRQDAPALALRGIALAQLGEYPRARALLREAQRRFGAREAVARARCLLAEAEVALASRELGWVPRHLAAARAVLEAAGDQANAQHARILEARHLLLLGRPEAAGQALGSAGRAALPPALEAARALVRAGIALRGLQAGAAAAALLRARAAAHVAAIPALTAEVEAAARLLDAPAARLAGPEPRLLRLAEVERLLGSGALVVDACRHLVCEGERNISLARRPVLFALARALGEAWPGDAPREALIRQAFRAREADESHRARLRVEIGRLRAALRPLARIGATPRGFAMAPRQAADILVLARPAEEPHAAVLALLADGEAWSSSALALALGTSQRSLQRALEALATAGKVQGFGRGPARRWLAQPLPGVTPGLLLPGLWPGG
ncbi:helix-turn-helix domain-containing protein [Siccirubricoccus phaeus]|uniref:helix-turn-helix domain-containing protein n=1 Tax=Siccirubricoccus phaeus TaxID=2595053 RepID=UPI0011F25D0E|nr:helix-turn-helix domain-containing protein [Siccirubricoccus phaeus]